MPTVRRPGKYRAPSYKDPKDRRLVEIIQLSDRPAEGAVNILGVPFDGAVLGRKGAAGGPDGLRGALSGFSNFNVELGMGLEEATVVDVGDLVGSDDVDEMHKEIEREVESDLVDGSLLVVVGGDNSVSLPSLRALSRRFGKIGLVVIDSHLDLRGKIGGKPTSGSSYGLAIESIEGLDPRRVSEVGIHGFLNSKEYVDKARDLGISIYTKGDVKRSGAAKVAAEAYAKASRGADAVYVSIDLDAVDLSAVSGVSAPSVGGISADDLIELAYYLGGRTKVKCADIVELAPSLDPSGRSERVAATSLVNLIAGFNSRPKV